MTWLVPRWIAGVMLLAASLCGFEFGVADESPFAPAADGSGDYGIPSSPGLPVAVDLRPYFEQWELARSRQGDRPTCSVFTVVGSLEFAIAKRFGSCPRLSVEFLNWASNQVAGDADDGGFFSDLWSGFAGHGICRADDAPYQRKLDASWAPSPGALVDARRRRDLGLRLHWIKPWDVNTGLNDEQWLGVRRAISAGWPVCGGFRWPKKEQWVDDVLQMCPANAVRDGHSVLLVGYRDAASQPGGGVLIFRNTSRNGQDGLMPYAYARAFMNDAAWVE